MKENLDYKVKIDIPNITELISETFDGVLNHMFPGMLVFGGALRDITAGFGLHYDLDIAASHSEGKKFIQYLETSSKWVEECVIDQYKRQAKIMEDKIPDIISPHSMENGMLDLNRNFPSITKPKFSNYGNIQGGNIQSVRTFINPSGKKLQIVISKSDLFTLKEQPPILIVKTVDFICCGIMMDIDGNVYEIIEGAEDDCVKKILRINRNANVKFHNLNERIKKLTNRGWKSKINLAQIKHKQAHLKRITERKFDEYSLDSIIQKHTLSNGKAQIIINTSKMRIFRHCNNSATRTLELFYSIFKNHDLVKTIRSCGVSISHNGYNHAIISVTGKNTETMSLLKKTLLYQEHKILPSLGYKQECKIDLPELKKKNGGYFSRTIFVDQSLKVCTHKNEFASKVYDYPLSDAYTFTSDAAACSTGKTISPAYIPDEEIKWIGVERKSEERKVREPDLEMFEEKKLKKEKLAEFGEEKPAKKHKITDKKVLIPDNVGLINKTELLAVGGYNASGQLGTGDQTMENCSNLKITKKEKMEIEYGAHLIGSETQHGGIVNTNGKNTKLYPSLNNLSKCFTKEQIGSLNTEEKGALAKYLVQNHEKRQMI